MTTSLSLVISKEMCFYANTQDGSSSLWQLIQGIWQEHSPQARAILRERIYTTEKLSPLNHGIIKISAKRVAAEQPLSELEKMLAQATDKQEITFINSYEPPSDFHTQLQKKLSLEEIKNLLQQLSELAPRPAQRHQQDRAVGALLLDKNDQLLALAHNTNRQNKTLHAEVNLIQSWRKPLPDGARIVTSLEPCKMCVGLILSQLQHPKNFRLEFLEHDTGPAVRQSWLPTHKI